MQPPAAADFLRACHSCFQMEFHAVLYGGLGQRQRQIPRLHNGRTGRIQRAAHRIGKIRLHGQRFLPRQHAHAGHAVRHTVFVQAAHGCHFLIGKSQHQAADLAVFDVERSALLFRQRTSPHIQPRHGGARFRVVPRVHDGAVGACGAHGDVVLLFKHRRAQLMLRQQIGHVCAHDAAADDGHIQHIVSLRSGPPAAQRTKTARTGGHAFICRTRFEARRIFRCSRQTMFPIAHFAYRSCSLRNMVSMPPGSCFACGSHSPTGHIIP